jgi:hypothetical protein
MARNQRLCRSPVDIVDVRLARRPADLEDVAEPLGGDETDRRLLALDEQVRHEGARVDEAVHRREGHAGLSRQANDPVEDAGGQVIGRARHFEGEDATTVGEDEVGVGAAGVHADRDASAGTGRPGRLVRGATLR